MIVSGFNCFQSSSKLFRRQQLKRLLSTCSSKSSNSYLTPDGRLTALGASIEAERCLLCVDAPCAKACPADTKPDKFLRQLRFENPLGAAETVLDNNPLGGVCGTVCPVSKLCEGACTRKNIDGPVKIGAVQRYLHDYGVAEKLSLPPVLPGVKHKTAVIGAGPAGLAAARELARRGSQVTVYERRPEAGGALRYALSPLRISHKLVEEEVQRIASMGVKFKFNSNVDDIAKVMKENDFDALFVSPGLQSSRQVEVEKAALKNPSNTKHPKIASALSFLEGANTLKAEFSTNLVKGKTVVVIGGGSVAMDCAITAKSLGATSIHLFARESMLALPADEDEIKLAREAGVVFHPETDITSTDESSNIYYRTLSNNNDSIHASLEGRLQASTIIVAAGQLHDKDGAELIKTLKQQQQQQSSKSKLYAGGDAVRPGGATVVEAVADGKRAAIEILPQYKPAERIRPSLEIEFLGLKWENPFTLSSSPVTNSAEMIARAYDAGFSGSYYKTLNREDKFIINHPSPRLGVVHHHNKGSSLPNHGNMEIGIQNLEQISDRPLQDNLKDITWLRKNYPTKIHAVSIMGYCDDDWQYLAQAAEGAGAHLLELNFSCPQMARNDAGHHVGQQFDLIERYTSVVKKAVKIPVVAKLTPNITDMVPAALSAQAGGADAISAINTLKSISHIDLESLQGTPNVAGKSAISGFSGKGCRPFGLRFVSELAREKRLKIPISGMGGIYTWKDCVEYLAVGSSNLQMTTSVMQHGNRIIEDLIDGLQRYLERNQMKSVSEIIGRANQSFVQPSAFDMTSEVVSVIDPNLCIGCGVCEVACRDGAAHAISLSSSSSSSSDSGSKRIAKVDRQACVGCKLCQFVCPVGAISFETRPRIDRPRFSK